MERFYSMASGNGELRSREKLKKYVQCEITRLFSSVLDYAEVAIDSKARYTTLRSKVLKVSNDAIREINRELDNRYDVTYLPPAEEVIVIKQKK